jgi:hypothetical protein
MGQGAIPAVCVVGANVPPLLWVRRSGPLIVMPRRLATQFTDEQLACVLSHEIAHYVRRDHWTNLLSLMAAAVCWWNPVAWWARRELRRAQEACCDALVISRAVTSRRTYAETVWQALEFIQAERLPLPALASGFGGKSSVERRLEMIANPRVSHRLSWRSYAVLIGALAILPCSLALTETPEAAPDRTSQAQPQDVQGRVAQYERAFQRQIEIPREFREGIGLNARLRRLQSRLKDKYPEGDSAEYRREFLRGLKDINRELEQQTEAETRAAERERMLEYEWAYRMQMEFQAGKDK